MPFPSSRLLALSALAVAGTLLFSCTSSDPHFNPALVTAHAWKMTATTASPAIHYQGRLVTDVYDSLPIVEACDKHRLTTYNPNNTISLATDSVDCELEGDTLTWSLNSAQNVLTVTQYKPEGHKVTVNTILNVNSTTLVVSWVLSVAEATEKLDSVSHVVTETYTAQ